MKIVDVSKVPVNENPHHVDARKVYDTEHATAVVITLAPGESLKKHITGGCLLLRPRRDRVVEIGDERATVGRDHLVESRQRSHRWINESDRPFRCSS